MASGVPPDASEFAVASTPPSPSTGSASRPSAFRGRRTGVDVVPAAIRRARERAGLSQAQLGGRDLSRQAVHLIETGKVRPSIDSLTVIAERLGLPISAFLAVGGPPPGSPGSRLAELERLCTGRQYEQVLDLANDLLTASPQDRVAAVAHHWAGIALYQLGRPEEALVHLRQAEMLADRIEDPWLAAESMDWRATALNLQDDGRALEAGFQALNRYRALEPRRPEVEARMLEHMGTFWSRRQGYDQAEACYREALRVVGKVRDLERMARLYHGLAGCSRAVGDLDTAADLMHKAVAFYVVEHELRPAGAAHLLARAENDYGVLLMEQGRLDLADELVQTALDRLDECGENLLRSHFLESLGQVRMRQNRHHDAFRLLAAAVEQAQALNQPIPLAEAHQALGDLHALRDEADLADASYQVALDVLEAAGLTERALECQRAWRRVVARRSQSRTAANSRRG